MGIKDIDDYVLISAYAAGGQSQQYVAFFSRPIPESINDCVRLLISELINCKIEMGLNVGFAINQVHFFFAHTSSTQMSRCNLLLWVRV